MFMVVKRKQIALIFLVLIISIIMGLFFKSKTITVSNDFADSVEKVESVENNQDETIPGEAVMVSGQNNSETFVSKAKKDRDFVRSKSLEILNESIKNEFASDEFKQEAEAQILQTASAMDTEKKIETLLFAKGYKNTVVFISNNSTTVTVDASALSETDVAKINDIVFNETGNNNIKIVELN